MRILIVEDETAAYENLADMLVTIDPTLEIMGNTESVQQTVRWLQANPEAGFDFYGYSFIGRFRFRYF